MIRQRIYNLKAITAKPKHPEASGVVQYACKTLAYVIFIINI